MDIEVLKKEAVALLEQMGFKSDLEGVESSQGLTVRINIRLSNYANMLIGERGNNLIALEYILKKIIFKKYNKEGIKFTLDINDYRVKRLEELKQDIKSAAKQVRIYKKEVPLRYMSAFERRIVHLLLAEYPDIITESVGEEPNRRVVIRPYNS